jgi:1-acyl-sn-glycerol-3-phosphate acyltransferase
MFRTLRAYLITNLASIVLFILFYLSGSVAKRLGSQGHGVARFFSRRLLGAAGVKVRASGLDNLTSGGPFVLVANHLSLADTPLLMGYVPADFRFIAKASLFRSPIIGAHLRRGGHIPVVREDPRSAVKSLSQAAELLKQGISILLFAEGTRSDGRMQDFKGGAAHLAIKAGVPVVPIAVSGTPAILSRGSLTIRSGCVTMQIGKPIFTHELGPKDRDRLTSSIQLQVAGMLEKPLQTPPESPILSL